LEIDIMFTKAQRTQAKLRLALCGPAGSGKTYSALLIAKGLAPEGRIALIDTERGSGSLYSHLADYDVAPLSQPFSPERYIQLIQQAEQSGYEVLIIDSLSHAWAGEGGILDLHDKASLALRSGNSFAAWREVTPKHNALVDALIGADLHLILTLRTKVAYEVADDGQGKKRPLKIGLAPIQRDGLEYEFTAVLDLSVEGHVATAAKDRSGVFDGAHWVPTRATGEALRDWLNGGVDAVEQSRRLLERFSQHVTVIDSIAHLNSWWRANQDTIATLLPIHVDALKNLCTERRDRIKGVATQAEVIPIKPKLNGSQPPASH
jgi:DNA polymerase III epsilon subunit-like protein